MNPGERRFTHECGQLDLTQKRRARRGGSEVRLGEPMVYFSAFSASLRDTAFSLSLLGARGYGRAPSQSLGVALSAVLLARSSLRGAAAIAHADPTYANVFLRTLELHYGAWFARKENRHWTKSSRVQLPCNVISFASTFDYFDCFLFVVGVHILIDVDHPLRPVECHLAAYRVLLHLACVYIDHRNLLWERSR